MTEKKGEFVPAQQFKGMQVIDSKGSSVGTVRDIGVNVVEKRINLIVAARTGADLQVAWEDIQSVVDVVLLRKEIEVPKGPKVGQMPIPPSPPTVNCPNCGTAVIPTARFCPTCGRPLK